MQFDDKPFPSFTYNRKCLLALYFLFRKTSNLLFYVYRYSVCESSYCTCKYTICYELLSKCEVKLVEGKKRPSILNDNTLSPILRDFSGNGIVWQNIYYLPSLVLGNIGNTFRNLYVVLRNFSKSDLWAWLGLLQILLVHVHACILTAKNLTTTWLCTCMTCIKLLDSQASVGKSPFFGWGESAEWYKSRCRVTQRVMAIQSTLSLHSPHTAAFNNEHTCILCLHVVTCTNL